MFVCAYVTITVYIEKIPSYCLVHVIYGTFPKQLIIPLLKQLYLICNEIIYKTTKLFVVIKTFNIYYSVAQHQDFHKIILSVGR